MTIWPKRIALATLNVRLVGRLLSAMRAPRCIVFMLHRFQHDGALGEGHRPERMAALLEYLRASRVDMLPIADAIRRFGDAQARPTRSAVSFTVDDCYGDLRDVGLPIFMRYDCPVTGFVVPDAVDGKQWYWWDHVEWLLRRQHGAVRSVNLDWLSLTLDCRSPQTILSTAELVSDALKLLPTSDRARAVEQLSELLGTPIPERAPAEYAVMSWDDLRAAERLGMQFGPHTVSHPVLSRCSDEQSEREIRQSVARLKQELRQPAPVFCYPVGRREDFGRREMETVKAEGLVGAVSSVPCVLQPQMDLRLGTEWRWAVPRFPYDERAGAAARRLFL